MMSNPSNTTYNDYHLATITQPYMGVARILGERGFNLVYIFGTLEASKQWFCERSYSYSLRVTAHAQPAITHSSHYNPQNC